MIVQDIGVALDGDVGPAVDAFLGSLAGDPRILALGEPTHHVETFPLLRNQIFQHLVEHHGYRSIAIESGCLAGLVVNSYVVDGIGSFEDVMRDGFSHEFGKFESSRALVRWMREYNENHPEPIRFFGFDGPFEVAYAESPRQAITELNAYLGSPYTVDSLLFEDERWTNPEVIMDPTKSVGSSDEVKQLRLIVDHLRGRLTEQTPQLVALSRDDWWRARLFGRTATALLRYHEGMAVDSPDRISYLLGIRDGLMAENLKAITEYGKTFVFAHNSHLQRRKSSMNFAGAHQEWWSAGAIVSAELREEYVFIATAMGTAPNPNIGAPQPGTLEGVLDALPGDYLLNSADVDVTGLERRKTDNFAYAPLDPTHVRETDGIVFIKTVPQLYG
ncbi:erythromycin esterase family protein [Kibdelosporangium philippinense]|uniref:Erythromycin esterase family protein n=1 Tax=Kibdelosporangium philippinense TaxID=211113 RepID=A0ABS8ZQJ2_9PSEU|nr:erythromycin esterase family protein [Kibdelosporangium philippinense]MCE7008891.1 erythromycin esterase family protein [Kibdelosporangium philippinense]